MKDPFEKVRWTFSFLDDSYSDFFPRREQEEVRKVIDRYIKKTKPKIFIMSTDE